MTVSHRGRGTVNEERVKIKVNPALAVILTLI